MERKKTTRITKKSTVDNRTVNGGAREKKPIKEIREMIKDIVNGYMTTEQLQEDLKRMKPTQRIFAVSGLLQYVTPKLANLDLSATVDVKEDKVDKKLDELDKEEE